MAIKPHESWRKKGLESSLNFKQLSPSFSILRGCSRGQDTLQTFPEGQQVIPSSICRSSRISNTAESKLKAPRWSHCSPLRTFFYPSKVGLSALRSPSRLPLSVPLLVWEPPQMALCLWGFPQSLWPNYPVFHQTFLKTQLTASSSDCKDLHDLNHVS